jgi:RimJ/RimL family protein N-acetyltransferase
MSAPTAVRPAIVDDVPAIQAVEVAAGERFREIDEPRIARCADAPPYSTEGLARAATERRAWVAVDAVGSVIGFAVAWVVDGEGHLDELAVVPAHGRRGVGRALVDEVIAWSAAQELPSVTLTTFRDVPWNAPYYEKLGFRVVPTFTPALRALVDEQATWGLDPSLRVVMRRSLVDGRQDVAVDSTLLTDRLVLRWWRSDDLDALTVIFAKPDVWRFPFRRGWTAEETEEFLGRKLEQQDSRGWTQWAVETRVAGRLIGFIGLAPPDFLPEVMPAVEIGWRLDPDYWGQGLATEGARVALTHAFRVLHLPEVVSIYQPENEASGRIMGRLGMRFDRDTRHPSLDVALRVFRLSRDDWEIAQSTTARRSG